MAFHHTLCGVVSGIKAGLHIDCTHLAALNWEDVAHERVFLLCLWRVRHFIRAPANSVNFLSFVLIFFLFISQFSVGLCDFLLSNRESLMRGSISLLQTEMTSDTIVQSHSHLFPDYWPISGCISSICSDVLCSLNGDFVLLHLSSSQFPVWIYKAEELRYLSSYFDA